MHWKELEVTYRKENLKALVNSAMKTKTMFSKIKQRANFNTRDYQEWVLKDDQYLAEPF